MKYTSYQLNQYILSVFKRFKKIDSTVNMSIIEQHELVGYPDLIIDNQQHQVVMLMIVRGDVIGRKQLDFYFDNNGVFCYYQRDENISGRLN